MPINGKLQVTIKITELPTDVETDRNGWKKFKIACGGHIVAVSLRPRLWAKLEDFSKNYSLWVAQIYGELGQFQGQDVTLLDTTLQVIERTPPPKEPSDPEPAG